MSYEAVEKAFASAPARLLGIVCVGDRVILECAPLA